MPFIFNPFSGTLDYYQKGGATSVSNSDGTLTISPTTGAVVASIALGHRNNWTNGATFTGIDGGDVGYTVSLGVGTTALRIAGAVLPDLTYDSGSGVLTAAGVSALSYGGTWQGNPIGVAYGGTNISSYAVGDIIYASGATTLSKLADIATGNALISGGVTTAPSWGKIGLTTHVTGILANANGGTGVTTAVAVLAAANTFTVAPQQITIDASNHKGLIIKGAASQSVNLSEIQNSSAGIEQFTIFRTDTNSNIVADFKTTGNIVANNEYAGSADIMIGGLPNSPDGYGGVWLAQASPSSSNYLLLGSGSQSFINAPSGGDLELRVGNGSVINIAAAGVGILFSGNVQPTRPLEVKATYGGTTIFQLETTGKLGLTTSPTAYLHLPVGTTAATTSPFKFTMAGSAVMTTPETGAVETSTDNIYLTKKTAIRESIPGVVFTQTADKTVSNTTTETSIVGTGVGTLTLPANFFIAGKTIRVTMSGVYSTVAVTGDTVTIKVKYGSTVLASKATTALVTGGTNLFWASEVLVTCRSTGASGSVQVSGGVIYQIASSATVEDELNNGVATTTLDTTASGLFDVTITHSAANASNTVKSLVATFEVIN